jgi:NAD+ kinase
VPTHPFALDALAGGHVGVLVNPSGDCGPQLGTLHRWAREAGVDVRELGTSADSRATDGGCRLVVALGGDGTILRALQLAIPQRAPVLGINFGRVGFLADVDRDRLDEALEAIGRGEAYVDERTALVATFGAHPAHRVVAVNDVVIGRAPGHGRARLRVYVGQDELLPLAGDGVVVASPTGSTAYTVGAGGPAVAPGLDAIVLTPLAAQGSPLRSLVVEGSDRLRIEMDDRSAPLHVEIDGRTRDDLPPFAVVEVQTAPRKARLLRTRPRTFFHDLAERL